MKVLFVTNWFPTDKNPVFGVFIKEHAIALRSQGTEVRVLQIFNRFAPKLLHVERVTKEIESIKTVQVFIESRFHDITQYVLPLLKKETSRALDTIWADFKPDLVHGNVVFSAGVLAKYAADKYSVPYYLTEHWTKAPQFLSYPFLGDIAKKIYQKAGCTFPVSNWLKEQLQNGVEGNANFKVIPNVVNPDVFYYQTGIGRRKNGLHLLVIQNFNHKPKRPDLLLKALEKLPESRQKSIHLTFIGAGIDERERRKIQKEFGNHATITFKAAMAKDKLCREMQKSDFLMHPSDVETFGLVTAESLSAGLPAIVSGRGALPELVDENSGRIVNSNTVEAWTRALTWVLKHKDYFDRRRISEINREKYSPESVGHQMLEGYKNFE